MPKHTCKHKCKIWKMIQWGILNCRISDAQLMFGKHLTSFVSYSLEKLQGQIVFELVFHFFVSFPFPFKNISGLHNSTQFSVLFFLMYLSFPPNSHCLWKCRAYEYMAFQYPFNLVNRAEQFCKEILKKMYQ